MRMKSTPMTKSEKYSLKRLYNISSNSKPRLYVRKLLLSKKFRERIQEFRRLFSIPDNGYAKKDLVPLQLPWGEVVKVEPMLFSKQFSYEAFRLAGIQLCGEFGLDEAWFVTSIKPYILRGKPRFPSIRAPHGFCVAYDLYARLTAKCEEYDLTREIRYDSLVEDTKHRPIAILISPYASGRDVVEFIKKSYRQKIEPCQLQYRRHNISLGRNRIRVNENMAIYELILAHPKLPRKTVQQMIKKRAGKTVSLKYISVIRGRLKANSN